MDNALLVRSLQSMCKLDCQVEGFILGQGTASQLAIQRYAVNELGHEEIYPLLRTEFVHRGDIGMIEPGKDESLLAKPRARVIVG